MATNTLTAGMLGLDQKGQLLLEAAHTSGYFDIRAVADPDLQRAERLAAEFRCEPYTDYRQLIVQNQLDCLLVAIDIHTCDEHLRAALKKKFNVLKLAPPARNFEEALGYAQLAETQKVRFAIANPARFMASHRTAHELIKQGHVKQLYLVTAQYVTDGAGRPAWQADPKLAGGGVLLHDCYQSLDEILWNFPLPQQVYALTSNQAPDKQQRLYLTEDTAVVSLKFSDTLTGNIVAMRRIDVGTTEVVLRIHGKETCLTVTDSEVTLRAGSDERRWQFAETPHDVMVRVVSSFANSILRPDEHELVSSAAENLKNMAVLESAYLSARTGFPEEPARIPQMSGAPAGAATGL
ncbi:MAG: Gfo/Idh/MocA family oxidoreductase [Sedimentisphaerales bacterium]|nr:Gfo/Idh/MocA family oxidoreductase [Sedimentisphaerales bacterium]